MAHARLVEVFASDPAALSPALSERMDAALAQPGPAAASLAAELLELIQQLDRDWVGLASTLAVRLGALVEAGIDPDAIAEPLVAWLAEIVPPLVDAWLAAEPESEADPAPDERDEVREFLGAVLRNLELAAAAILSRSRKGRDRVAREPALRAATIRLRWAFRFLHHITHVLDDAELLVIHPGPGAARWGYRVRIGGIADNWQLHLLLADALHRAHPSPSWAAPAADAVAVLRGPSAGDAPSALESGHAIGIWDTYAWTAHPSSERPAPIHWIWGEGVPADIPRVEVDGRELPVILLGRPSYERSTTVVRAFEALPARVEVLTALGRPELDTILAGFAGVADDHKRALLEAHADAIQVALSSG